MKTPVSTGLRLAAWTTCGLLAMGAAAGTATAVAGHDHHPGGGGSPGQHGPSVGGMLPGLVHGVGTFKTKGGYQTLKEQTGTVTDVNIEALIVTSSDEYAAQYVISSKTKVIENCKPGKLSDLVDGDSIRVVAKKVNGHFTALVISEGNGNGNGNGNGGHHHHGGHGGHGGGGYGA